MIDDHAKTYLHDDLREIREAMLSKLGGLSEYDIRRPLTTTGTNLLGLVKHLSISEARYLGEVFDRPFPELLPRWDDKLAVPTCGRPSTRHAPRSSTATGACGPTPTPRSTPCPSTPPATCRGGRGPT
jgi:hypothetical protein